MAFLRSRRLDGLFGSPLELLTAAAIQSLVSNRVTEEFDLDFKAELYGRGDSAKRDLAGDVAALANTAGGIIIIGVAEDEQARATAADGVELSDGEKARMFQVLASGISPMPLVDILQVPLQTTGAEQAEAKKDETASASLGYYVVAVPRSPAAPHAVLVNDGFRYPKRNGATTRYLSEPEVASAYRDRITRAESQNRRIEAIEHEAIERLELESQPWVMVSLVPDLPGDFQVTHQAEQAFQRQVTGKPALDILGRFYGISTRRGTVGRRRFVGVGNVDGPSARYVCAEYHWDGAGTYSVQLWDLLEHARTQPGRSDLAAANQIVSDEALALAVLTGLRRLADHAVNRAAAGGNALVRALLLPTRDAEFGIEIGSTRGFGSSESRSSIAQTDVHSAETVVSLDDIASGGPELVAAAARLIDELGQIFGIAELGQFTQDGQIRIRYWDRRSHDQLRSWAETRGVTVSDKVLGA
jgi:hypothetical protein